jgi:hypothetical protein
MAPDKHKLCTRFRSFSCLGLFLGARNRGTPSVSIRIKTREARKRGEERRGTCSLFLSPAFFLFSRSLLDLEKLRNLKNLQKNEKRKTVPPRDLHCQVQAGRQDLRALHGDAHGWHQVRLVARPVRKEERKREKEREGGRERGEKLVCIFWGFSLSFFCIFLTRFSQKTKQNAGETAATPLFSPSEPARSSRVRKRRERKIKRERRRILDGTREETRSLAHLFPSFLLLLLSPFSLFLSLSLFHFIPLHSSHRLGRWPQLDVCRGEAQAQDPLGHGLRSVVF